MASSKKKKKQQEKPAVDVELTALGADDVGANFVEELRLPGDGILRSKGGGDLGIYENLLTDWQCYSTFQQRRTAIISKEVMVEPGAEDAASVKAADFWERQIKALGFDESTRKQMMSVWDGFGASELMFAADGREFFIEDIRKRKSRRFRFGVDGSLRLITKSNQKGIVLPETKFWITQAGSNDDDDPYGLGLGHYCYWPVWLKRNALRHWSLFLETFARGRPIAKVPPGLKPEAIKKIKETLGVIAGGGTAVVSDNVAIQILEAVRNSGGDFSAFCAYLDGAISKIILSQTMTTDDGSSLSQAQVHGGVKDDVIKADADLICESFNRGPVKWLTAWNFPGATPPRIWRRCEEPTDLTQQAQTDKALYSMGFVRTEESVLDVYGPGYERKGASSVSEDIEEQPGDGEDEDEPNTEEDDPAVDGEEPEPEETEADQPEFAEGDLGPSHAVSTELTGGEEWRPIMEPTVAQIENLLDDCDSLEEFRDRLGEVADGDPTELQESLARSNFAGHVAGRLGIDFDDHED